MKMLPVYLFLLFWSLVLIGCASQTIVVPVKYTDQPVQKVMVGNVEIGYRILGEGQPLLMIMGYAVTMDTWDSQMISQLSKNHKLILYDNRGTGYSTIDDSELTLSQMASDAVQLLDILGIEKADVMGWSMGSIIAQEMVLAYPDKVKKVVLYSTAVDMKPVKDALDAMATMEPKVFIDKLFPEKWKNLNPDIYAQLPDDAHVPVPVIMRQYKAITDWKGTRDRVEKIDNSVLILVGEEDRITPLSQNLAAASLIPGAWVARFKAADHWLMYQAPEELAKTINFFLSTEQNLLIME